MRARRAQVPHLLPALQAQVTDQRALAGQDVPMHACMMRRGHAAPDPERSSRSSTISTILVPQPGRQHACFLTQRTMPSRQQSYPEQPLLMGEADGVADTLTYTCVHSGQRTAACAGQNHNLVTGRLRAVHGLRNALAPCTLSACCSAVPQPIKYLTLATTTPQPAAWDGMGRAPPLHHCTQAFPSYHCTVVVASGQKVRCTQALAIDRGRRLHGSQLTSSADGTAKAQVHPRLFALVQAQARPVLAGRMREGRMIGRAMQAP